MKTLTEQLTQYAAYHRDPRNIRTHFLGIPMIVLGVTIILAGISPLLATVAALVTVGYYLRLDLRYGLTMVVLFSICLAVSKNIAAQSTLTWVASGVGFFVVGWVLQFIGHYYEGKKPAFVDDLMGLIIGPLFVTAEAGFLMGLRKDVQEQIEAKVGPVRLNEKTAATAS